MAVTSELSRPGFGRVRVLRPLRAVPFAFGLISVLFLTTWWTRLHPDQAGDTFEWVSTNLHNLSIAPVRSFVLSALFLTDGRWLVNAALLAAVLIPLESRIGTRAVVTVFGSAHVLATVVTEGWVWLAIRAGAQPASAAFQQDVGISYGLYGAAGAVCYFLPRRVRPLGVVALAGYLGLPAVLAPSMTGAGHVLSLAIGLSWWPLLHRGPNWAQWPLLHRGPNWAQWPLLHRGPNRAQWPLQWRSRSAHRIAVSSRRNRRRLPSRFSQVIPTPSSSTPIVPMTAQRGSA